MQRVKKKILNCVDMKCDTFNVFFQRTQTIQTAYLADRQHCLLEFFQTRIALCFDQIVVIVRSQNHIYCCYYLALVVRQFVIQVSPFNLRRNNMVQMSTACIYNILSFCTNCHFCFLIFFRKKISMSSFKSCFWRKSQSFPESLKKYTSSELGVELSTFVHVKDTGRGTV